MNAQLIMLAIEFLSSPAGQKVIGKLTDGSANAGNLGGSILQGLGKGKINPTEADISDFQDLAGAFQNKQSSGGAVDNEAVLKAAEDRMNNAKQLYSGSASDIFVDSPEKMAIKMGIRGAANATAALGDMSNNNGNALAAAILQGFRTHSGKQDDLYGPNVRDKANAVWAHNNIRKGINRKTILDSVANTIDGGLREYNQQDLAAKQLAMTEATGKAPAALYDLFGRQQSAQSRGY